MEEERKGMRRRRLRGKSSTRQTLDRVLGSTQKPIPTPLTQPREDLLEPKAGRTETESIREGRRGVLPQSPRMGMSFGKSVSLAFRLFISL